VLFAALVTQLARCVSSLRRIHTSEVGGEADMPRQLNRRVLTRSGHQVGGFIPAITGAYAAHSGSQLNCGLQELFQFLDEAGQARVLLQEDVIPPRQCYKARTRYCRRQSAP
jgi:hypothetical protein